MLVWTLWLYICLSLGWTTATTASIDTLKSVQILFRHGARERDDGFEKPTGQLTPTGKKQMYDLGIFFRQRYDGLLKDVYDENEILTLSSDAGRAIQSASLVAYGLYKNFNAAASWNSEEKVPYEPIPVRSIPKKYDKYIQSFPDCPRLPEIVYESTKAFFDRFARENRDLIDYYYRQTGDETVLDSSDPIKQFIEMAAVAEELLVNVTNKIPISDWAEPLKNNQAFFSMTSGALRETVNTLEKKRLNAGPLIQLMTAYMDEAAASRKKMYLFSGHDRILIYLLETLGIYDPELPSMSLPGNAILMELHEDPEFESRPFVQFLTHNSTSHEPYIREMPNCGKPCYLSEFKQLTNEFIPTDFEAECASSNLKSELSPATLNQMNMTFLATFIIIALVSIVVFQIVLIKRKSYVRLG